MTHLTQISHVVVSDYWLLKIWNLPLSPAQPLSGQKYFVPFCSKGDWVPFSAMSWAWMKDSNHFSGLTSAFRAAYEQSNLKVGLISAFDRHTSINRSISADHALAHALEFGGEWRNLKKVSSFHYLTMYLNSFVPKTKHNCGCISQVCIYKGIFRFWSALCGLLGDKCSIASSFLVNKGVSF